jgi:hypothetical protein
MLKESDDRYQVLYHKGKQIYYSDYRGLMGDALAQQIHKNVSRGAELENRGIRNRLTLADFTDTVATQEVMDALKESAAKQKANIKATAVVGVTGMRKHLLGVINRLTGIGARPFDTIEQAKDWLVEQR